MTMKMKTVKTILAAGLALIMTAAAAHADTNPANDSGTFTVRITPNVDLGVTVDTTGSAWVGSANLDVAQDLGTDKLMGTSIGIAMAGNLNNQELTLQGVALNTWVLDTDEIDVQDQMRLYALFGKVAGAASPLVSDFTGTQNLITTIATRAGQIQANEGGDTGHVYELPIAHGQYADVDGMAATATRRLWLRSRTPATTSTDQQQAFTVIVTAVSGTGL
jgi:hypothetical protein